MDTISTLNVSEIIPGDNDRTVFDQAALEELAASIKKHGLAQPITVRPLAGTDLYQIVAGERRFRAISQVLGWPTCPCIIREDLDDEAAAAIMLTENVSRADLDPIDEGRAYDKRMKQFGWSVDECARRAGVSPMRIHFRLKLLRLREDVQALIRRGNVPLGYAQILADANLDPNRQGIAIARLNDNASPTPGWFRREVSDLLEEQTQDKLFDLAAYFQAAQTAAIISRPAEPPSPETTTPPIIGASIREIISNQIAFWQQAAAAWENLGKSFKKQECIAAAAALQYVIIAI